MPGSPPVSKSSAEHGETTNAHLNVDRDDVTPRSEVPVSVKVMAPSLSEETATVTDYFAPDPNASETSSQHAPSSPSTTRLSSTTAASHATATGTIVPETSYTSTPERPVPQRDISNVTSASVQSTDSAATITPATANLASIVEARPRPAYPDQSFAALQGFQYPHRGGHLPALRQRSSNPSNASQILTFSSALASMHQTGSRTAGNSPAPTPGGGLFSPSVPTSAREEWESPETPGTYASPFLHFTHRQAPKETHVADVDVDPISGRKLINHYEIIDELGRGAHGKVKLGRDLQTHDTHVAIKIVERYSTRRRLGKIGNAQDKVKKEIAILKKARHPNVVALLEVIDDPSRKKVYIVLEWVERGEIQWRAGAPKEIAMIEARRYERERRAIHDPNLDAVDVAVTTEAQKRLRRKKRTQLRTFRKLRQEASANPAIWSHEMHGDDDSEESDDDRLSRVSTGTAESTPMEHSLTRLLTGSGRRASRTPSPLPPIPQGFDKDLEQFLALTEERQVEEPDTMTPSTPTGGHAPSPWTGLEGTMYGAYDPSSGEPSRESSMNNSVHSFPPSRQASLSAEELMRLANEALECDLNSELQYVPCMTMYNVRVAFRDTLLGLQYLHAQGIVHRDIKPPNLLQTTDGRVKISDFGVSYLGRPLHGDDAGEDVSESEARDLDDEAKELAKTVGTPAFFAPELCITEVLDDPPPITKAIDVWALGITLFCMIYARTPYVDNEFVVMRMVADEDIYIPRRRLLPINQKSQSRPSSHSRTIPTIHAGRRHELDMMYEDIDDDLYDLLKRLLIKDPRKRITLEEVRHHPWVVADLSNRMSWLEETDPALPNQGKKIEVSNEDVNTAVVPLQWVERVRSGIKKVGERLGFSTKTVRGRSGSSVGMSGPGGSPVPSAHSSSSTISQDARRQSVRGDESIFSALKASKEGSEHPLSKSVAASPDFERGKEYFDGKPPRPESVASVLEESDERPRTRPSPPERSKTLMSTAGSVRTLRQSDFKHSLVKESPPPSPGLPGTPTALDSPGGSNLGGLLGGAGRRILKTVRERSAARSVAPDLRGRSKDRSSVESFDMHGGPSLAISQTLVAGRVNQPDVLRDATPASSANNSARNSPSASRAHSVVASPQHLKPSGAGALSRQSSLSSIASASRVSTSYSNHDETPIKQQSRIVPPESTAEDWQRASDERLRKLIREGEETSRPTSSFDDRTCPPSPDDHERRRGNSRRVSAFDISQPISSLETSPTGHGNQLPPSLVSSSSDFGSAVSMSISNPSIPSVISEASSIDPIEGVAPDDMGAKSVMDSDDTINSKQPTFSTQLVEDEEGYSPDHDETALDSEEENEYESSSESDGGLIMQRRKSATKPLYSSSPRNGGLSAALETAQLKQRRGTGVSRSSRKSSRSGSNNTMKKVWTRDSEDERQRMDITEE